MRNYPTPLLQKPLFAVLKIWRTRFRTQTELELSLSSVPGSELPQQLHRGGQRTHSGFQWFSLAGCEGTLHWRGAWGHSWMELGTKPVRIYHSLGATSALNNIQSTGKYLSLRGWGSGHLSPELSLYFLKSVQPSHLPSVMKSCSR